MNDECWLPSLEYYDSLSQWLDYENRLYDIFKKDFLDNSPCFEGVRVKVKHYPMSYEREEAFVHITTKNYASDGRGERDPDFRRCERIRWVKAFIENKCDISKCENCTGIKVWREPYKSRTRVHILLEEEKFMVVLEHRPKNEEQDEYYLLITAFYFDYQNALEKQLKKYELYRDKAKTLS